MIGEILAGILLGASLLGQFHDGHRTLTTVLFPADVVQIMKVLANLGLVIFMFIIGLELDLKLIKGNERRAGVISLSSIMVPFVGGALLALALYDSHSQGGFTDGHHVKKLAFALFIGASMCVTAFPVLARILNERGMTRTPLGVIALACAAIDDVVAWSLLAFVSAIAGDTKEPVWEVFVWSALYIAVMFGVVRPLLARFLVPIYQKRRPAHAGRPGVSAGRADPVRLDDRPHRDPLHLRRLRLRAHRASGGHRAADRRSSSGSSRSASCCCCRSSSSSLAFRWTSRS